MKRRYTIQDTLLLVATSLLLAFEVVSFGGYVYLEATGKVCNTFVGMHDSRCVDRRSR